MDNKVYHYFYKITNKISGKYYYGVHSTTNINDGYMGSGSIITKIRKKYGTNNLEKEILKYFDSEEEMFLYESEFITAEVVADPMSYNLVEGGAGYRLNHSVPEHVKNKLSKKAKGRKSKFKNSKHIHKGQENKMIPKEELEQYLQDGWELGFYLKPESREKLKTNPFKGKHHSEETKKRQSEIKKNQYAEGTWVPHNKGIPMTAEHKELLRKINTGKKRTEEQRRKMSERQKGKKHSKEWNQHISESLKGHKANELTKQKLREKNSKKVDQYDLETGEFIQTFNSMKEAAESIGHPKSNSEIAKCCKGKHKQCCGYKWQWHKQ